jgi:uncharacterized membrane protein YdjX (TVP38/TMEM64 family)
MKLVEDLRRHPRKLLLLLLLMIAMAWVAFTQREHLTLETLLSYGSKLSPFWLLAGFILLPLAGFPVTVFLVLAGVRFGFWGGMGATLLAMWLHHLLAYYVIQTWFRERVKASLERAGYPVPDLKKKNQLLFTLFFAAFMGPPYIVKVYSLALTNLPFRIYSGVTLPVYLLLGSVKVAAGSAAVMLDATWVYIIIGLMILLAGITRWLGKRYAGKA